MHSGYTFRTRSIVGEQRRLGWETFHLTSPKHAATDCAEEEIEGLHFFRTLFCEGLKTEILERGVPESRVTVIANAVDVGEFQFGAAVDEPLKKQLGTTGCTVIGFIGSFYAYVGLDLLIGAFPLVLEVRPDARLLLVGGGPHEQALREEARRRSLHGKVVFAGRVPHAQVQRYYSIIDIFAYPRHSMRPTELVTPLKPLEAMAQGQLLVASDVGGYRERIRDGQTGVLIRAGSVRALADAVLRPLDQQVGWPLMGETGRRFVEEERNWANSVARYGPVFDRLIETAT